MKPAVEDIFPLAPVQQGMLFHTLADPEGGYYVVQIDWTIDGELDVAAFEHAWRHVTQRHPSLRSGIVWQGQKEPLQVVRPTATLEIEQVDWSALDAAAVEREHAALLAADRKRGFTLAQAPLMRLKLIRLGPRQHRLLWTQHHVIIDGWSLGLVINEVLETYRARRAGQEPTLPPVQPFRRFIDWLRKRPKDASRTFWEGVLAPYDAATPLGIDHPATPPAAGPTHAAHPFAITPALTERLNKLAAAHQVTLSTVVNTAWAILLARHAGTSRVLFGSVFAARPPDLAGADAMVGCFMNSLPVPLELDESLTVVELLRVVQARFLELREHEHAALIDIQKWSRIPAGQPLFESMVVFENTPAARDADDLGFTISGRGLEQVNYPLTAFCEVIGGRLQGTLNHDRARVDDDAVARCARRLEALLGALADAPQARVGALSILPADEAARVLTTPNATATPVTPTTLPAAFEAQVDRTPDAIAVDFRGTQITYRELDARANQLASRLRALGVARHDAVGLSLERSTDLLVGLLGILKAGAAYLPLDPSYPAARLAWMVDDSRARVIVTDARSRRRVAKALPAGRAITLVGIDDPAEGLDAEPTARAPLTVGPGDLAYLIYTSGSTGRPKGVMVPHGAVANFFVGMDARVGHDGPRVWAAATSISFDISVLELFWTLTRGFTIVLHPGDGATAANARAAAARPIAFSLYYFADDSEAAGPKYRLLLEGARFADERGFAAVWTPERHFRRFGGLFPNPSVTGAAVAAATRRIQIRAGSVVAPLHDPVRIAEEWSVVDNLSEGRVGIAFASGWHPDDFVFYPDRYAARREETIRLADTVRGLWRGEAVTTKNGVGQDVTVKIYPSPVQRELPVWLTSSGSLATFEEAGRKGMNVLTHLLGQDLGDLAQRIERYRACWREAGHPGEGQVTLMLHTFVGEDLDTVKATARAPFLRYLRSSFELLSSWLATLGDAVDVSAAELDGVLEGAFDRYFETAGLFGTPDSCLEMVQRLRGLGVDEIACLIDFGVPTELVLESLELLDQVRLGAIAPADGLLPDLVRAHRAGYLQLTPSLARALVADEDNLEALRPLTRLLVGGEALPDELAKTLAETVSGRVLNMYGPTETTVWSSCATVTRGGPVTIGTPIANTSLYVLDRGKRPQPLGLDGELYIGGLGVVDGYWQRPELTAERFLPDPYADRPGARMYATGDVVRRVATGEIEFRGRADHQLKIRGHRIEPGEIEAALTRQPGVGQALVVGRTGPRGSRLLAYLVPAAGVPRPTLDAVRDALRAELPEHMIPAAFGWLDALPLTPNGKLDRGALPDLETRAEVHAAPVAPSTPTELLLAKILCHVLQRETVGLHDNFFELGGDSLAAIQVTSQARKAGLSLTPGMLFEHPTIGALAARIAPTPTAAAPAAPAAAPTPPAEPASPDFGTGLSADQLSKFIKTL